MSKHSILKDPVRANLNLERELLNAGQRRAFSLDYSFSEYVSRLINKDLRLPNSQAAKAPRKFNSVGVAA